MRSLEVSDVCLQEVMRMEREFKCFAGCCWCAAVDCCAFDIRVEAPVGTPIGYVRQSYVKKQKKTAKYVFAARQ